MGVPFTFAGQSGPIPLAELDADFAALASGSAFLSPFQLNGSPGAPVSLKLEDGQAGNTIWSVNVGVNAVGEFEIIDNTAGTTPLKINTLGQFTFAAPTDGSLSAVTINGASHQNSGIQTQTIVQNSATSGAGGLLITSNPASPVNLNTSIALRNLVNVSGTIASVSIQGGTDLGNLAMIMTNANQGATFQGITGMPAGQVGLINNFNRSLGGFPMAFGTNNVVRMLIGGSGGVTASPTVAPTAGGSVLCGIQASSTASLGIFFGTGAPTFAAAQGSIYSNTTGAAGARLYVNTSGSTTWTPATSP